jgi:hypothetical protein
LLVCWLLVTLYAAVRDSSRVFQLEIELFFYYVYRMFLGFVAQTKGSDIAEGSSEQQVMELMMSRYYMLCPGYKYFIAHVGSCFLFY